MHIAGKWALAITAGGLALGALLGKAADPQIKDPAPQWWQLTGQDEAETFASASGLYIEAGPDDLNPFSGYRPNLDYDAEYRGDFWADPIPDYELSMLDDEPMVSPGEHLELSAEQAAREAEAAARDALARAAPEPVPAPSGNY